MSRKLIKSLFSCKKDGAMISIRNIAYLVTLCFLCSGCKKNEISRICKQADVLLLSEQTLNSFFDEALHEFIAGPQPDGNNEYGQKVLDETADIEGGE